MLKKADAKGAGAPSAARPEAGTGRIVERVTRLNDPAVQGRLADLKRSMADPVKAREFLRDVGTLTPSGKLSRRYGGR